MEIGEAHFGGWRGAGGGRSPFVYLLIFPLRATGADAVCHSRHLSH